MLPQKAADIFKMFKYTTSWKVCLAERVGFEPTVPLVREHAISNRAYSATLAPLL